MIQSILCGGWDLSGIQIFRNFLCRHSGNLHLKDFSDNLCRLFINHQLMLVLCRLLITIRRICTCKLSGLCHLPSDITDLFGSISAVKIIDKILKGDLQSCRLLTSILTVIMIINCDKTNPEERKQLLQIISKLNIITPESGQIFYYDTVYPSLFRKINQLCKCRTVKAFPAESIITFLNDPAALKFRMLPDIIIKQHPLIADTVTLFLTIPDAHILVFF